MFSTPTPLNPPARYHRGLYLFAVFMTCWAFLVVFIGATVKSHEAGLSIPDGFILHWIDRWWELPNLVWEFLHRMLVGVLCIGLLGLAISIYWLDKRPLLKRFVLLLIGIVVAQAVLGAQTVNQFAHWWTLFRTRRLDKQTFLAKVMAVLDGDVVEGLDRSGLRHGRNGRSGSAAQVGAESG